MSGNIRRRRTFGALVLVLAIGCGESTTAVPSDGPLDRITPTDKDDRLPRVEVSSNSEFRVDEAGITVAYTADGATVSVPVEVLGTAIGAREGARLRVSFTDLSDVAGQSGSAAVPASIGDHVVLVVVPGAKPVVAQAEQVDWLVRYTISPTEGDLLQGRRSLYHCLPKYTLHLWAPERLHAGLSSAVRVWLRDATEGTPVVGASVNLNGKTQQTDHVGQAAFDVTGDGESVALTATATTDKVTLSTSRTLAVVPAGAPRVFLSTDKPLYRPGQTIHIRTLSLAEADLKPVQAAAVTIEVRDGKGTKIFEEATVTDDFGIASLTAALAPQVNLGAYLITAIVNGLSVSRSVEVSEQKLPKFDVQVAFDETSFLPGQPITGTVTARYFFGKAVPSAAVELVGALTGPETSWTGTTNADGVVAFSLPSASSDTLVSVKVTDGAGFVVEKGVTALVAAPTMTVTARGEAAVLPGAGPWRVLVTTLDERSRPLASTCTLGEDTLEIGASGTAALEVTKPSGEVSCKAAKQRSGGGHYALNLAVAGSPVVLLRTDKTIYRPGETVAVTLRGNAGTVVTVDCVHRARIIDTRVVTLGAGAEVLDFSVGAGEEGTVSIAAAALDADETFATEKLVYVQRAPAQVSVKTTLPKYAPGEEATLEIAVTDGAGKGQASAVGIAIADESVFALAGGISPTDVAAYFLGSDAPIGIQPYVLRNDLEDFQTSVEASLLNQWSAPSVTWSGDLLPNIQSEAAGRVYSAVWGMGQEVGAALQAMTADGHITVENAEALIEALELVDFWGQPLRIDASTYDYGYSAGANFWLSSLGPDELLGSWDDVTVSFYLQFANTQQPAPQSMSDAATSGPGGSGGSDGADGPSDEDQDGLGDGSENEAPAAKPRSEFPETLYVNPALITDGSGKASITIPLADAITSWRVQAIANTQNGLVGGAQGSITVFQDFFVDADLPRTMTQGDRMEIPVGVFNFTEAPIEVTVTVAPKSWFTLLTPATTTVTVAAGASASVPALIEVKTPGAQNFEVSASAAAGTDAVSRSTKVIPDGQRYDDTVSGKLESGTTVTLQFPANAVTGGNDGVVKIMGSGGAQLLDGLEALLQAPNGCFEPMMNTTWINALVLDYLSLVGESKPDIEAMAKTNLDSGLQQTVTFECTDGGFTWFGNPDPPHVILSAFALIMFDDIAKYRSVDEGLVTRAQNLLRDLQLDDGRFQTFQGTKNELLPWDELRTSCVVAWGMAASDGDPAVVTKAISYISEALDLEADSYTMAMCLNAMLEADPKNGLTGTILNELVSRATVTGDEAAWSSDFPGITEVLGDVVSVETTALVAQALFSMEIPHALGDPALKFLARQKSPDGNFLSTQGTIQVLRAFAAAAAFGASQTDLQVTVTAGGNSLFSKKIDKSNRDVVHLVSLADVVLAGGDVPVTITVEGDGALFYQTASAYYLPWAPATRRTGSVGDIKVTYAPTTVGVGAPVVASIRAAGTGQGASVGDMPMVEFGIPPGFDADLSVLDQVVQSDPNVVRYEQKGDRVVVYLHAIPPGISEFFALDLPLRARFPMTVSSPVAKVWPFYKPAEASESIPVTLTVTP